MTFPKKEIWIEKIEQQPGPALYCNLDAPVRGGEGEEIEALQPRRGGTGTPVGGSTR